MGPGGLDALAAGADRSARLFDPVEGLRTNVTRRRNTQRNAEHRSENAVRSHAALRLWFRTY